MFSLQARHSSHSLTSQLIYTFRHFTVFLAGLFGAKSHASLTLHLIYTFRHFTVFLAGLFGAKSHACAAKASGVFSPAGASFVAFAQLCVFGATRTAYYATDPHGLVSVDCWFVVLFCFASVLSYCSLPFVELHTRKFIQQKCFFSSFFYPVLLPFSRSCSIKCATPFVRNLANKSITLAMLSTLAFTFFCQLLLSFLLQYQVWDPVIRNIVDDFATPVLPCVFGLLTFKWLST
jgi:hypothetical protein